MNRLLKFTCAFLFSLILVKCGSQEPSPSASVKSPIIPCAQDIQIQWKDYETGLAQAGLLAKAGSYVLSWAQKTLLNIFVSDVGKKLYDRYFECTGETLILSKDDVASLPDLNPNFPEDMKRVINENQACKLGTSIYLGNYNHYQATSRIDTLGTFHMSIRNGVYRCIGGQTVLQGTMQISDYFDFNPAHRKVLAEFLTRVGDKALIGKPFYADSESFSFSYYGGRSLHIY